MNKRTEDPINILIVDDRPENLYALEVALEHSEYQFHKALSGREALQLVKDHDFSVILLDVQMPGMDGFETARRVRQEKRSEATPIIFVTAIHRTEAFEHRGYAAGAVDYLFKPIDIDVLKAKISTFALITKKNREIQRQAELLKEAALREQEYAMLKQTMKAHDEFLSIAAHELKTPITPLNLQNEAFIELFQTDMINTAPREHILRLLQTTRGQINRLNRVVDDLLDVARIKEGILHLKREEVDLEELVKDTLGTFADGFRSADCQLSFRADGAVKGVWDRFRLEQVFTNLLTNALKYGAGRPIEVSVSANDTKARLAVCDHGIGVEACDHSRIFERFQRAVSSRHYGGLGLGLFIAKQIVLLHGGNISLESQPGFGAKFTVELPLQ